MDVCLVLTICGGWVDEFLGQCSSGEESEAEDGSKGREMHLDESGEEYDVSG